MSGQSSSLRHSTYHTKMRPSQLKLTCHQKILSDPIFCSDDSYDFFMKIWDKNLIGIQEQTNILFLNGANEIIAWRCFNTGSSNETLFDIRLIMACALQCLAKKIIPGHNHPSRILKPSRHDILITTRLKEACNILDIKLEDHLIICHNNYYSFADNGLIVG